MLFSNYGRTKKLFNFHLVKHGCTCGFSLVELLVAMSLTGLLLVLTTQVLTQTSGAVRVANSQRDNGAQARTVLDRIAADLSTAMLTGGATVVFNDQTTDQDPDRRGSQIGFLCLSRTREGGNSKPRASIVAYSVRTLTERVAGQTITYGCVHRGDDENLYVDTLVTAFTGLPSKVNPRNQSDPAASGVVRFHISFVLDNGTIVQVPPSYTMVSPTTGQRTGLLNGKTLEPGRVPIAFFPEDAPVVGPLAGRYVKSLIVGIACLEPSVLVKASPSQIEELHGRLGKPGDPPRNNAPRVFETPLEQWQFYQKELSSVPILQSIRFYQRTIPLS